MLFVVAAALTNEKREILLQMRPQGRSLAGLWEFPGGKVEAGETPESALIRELKEELCIEVEAYDLIPITFASEPLGDTHLVLLLYICRKWTDDPVAAEAPEIAWTTLEEMRHLPMPPADAPFIDILEKIL
jgi:8-oxo-dGTP diphosphatase